MIGTWRASPGLAVKGGILISVAQSEDSDKRAVKTLKKSNPVLILKNDLTGSHFLS
jgi:hypothetical protein